METRASTASPVGRRLKELFTIDPRAMAAFRIALGFVILFDFLTKSTNLTAFYTDDGVLPRALAIDYNGWWSFSFHMASGSLWFQALLMVFGVFLALAFILGYQTRFVTVALWLFVVSLHNRNHLILHSGDALLRLLLFWSMFLPLGQLWSLDRLKAPTREFARNSVYGLASAGILLQMFSIYFFTALLKNHPQWNKDFTALYYVMSLEQYTTPVGHAMLAAPWLMKALTATTYYLEFLGPILLFIPWLARYTRLLVPLMFIGFHLSLIATMNLGLFPHVCIAGWLLFFPDYVWNLVDFRKFDLSRAGRRLLAQLPEPYHARAPRWGRALAAVVLAFSIVSVMTWNVFTLPRFTSGVPDWIRVGALPLRLDQYWAMFAPYPMSDDGWFVVDGRLTDGTSYDTWNGKSPVAWDKPADLFVSFRNTQWRKYLGNVWLEDEDQPLQLAFGRYVCREWNRLNETREKGKTLATYKLYYMKRTTPPPGGSAKPSPVFLWQHDCFDNPDIPAANTPPVIKN